MYNSSRPFSLAAHDESASSVRQLVRDDPALDEIGGADGIKVCCVTVPDGRTFCGRDSDA
jgi:hypothetical protein